MSTTQQGFQKVAVGIDFSGSSDAALELARSRFTGAQLLLVHVVDARAAAIPDISGAGMIPIAPPVDLLETLSETDSALLDKVALPNEQKAVVTGEPSGALVEAAQQWGAELLLVGTHTRGIIEQFFVGSVAEQVVRKAHIPVLVIKHQKR